MKRKKIVSVLLAGLMLLSFGLYCPGDLFRSEVIMEVNAAEGRLYNQNDSYWKTVKFTKYSSTENDMYTSGCGIFSFCNAIYALNGNKPDAVEVATWAVSIGAYQPGNGGVYRETLYKNIQSKYGDTFKFTIDGYYSGKVTDARLINHLNNGGVAAIHVSNHFMAITGYNAANQTYHVIESAVYNGRGLQADSWVSASKLSSGSTNVDWYALISNTKSPTQKPSWSSLKNLDGRDRYTVGETITLKASSDLATGYTLGLDRNGTRLITEGMPDGQYEFKPTQAGDYSAYVTAWNDAGYVDSNLVTFTVFNSKPTTSILKTADGGSYYKAGTEITFAATSDYATGYTIGIDRGATRIVTEGMPNAKYSMNFDTPGDYTAYVTCWNNLGYVDSALVYFTIYTDRILTFDPNGGTVSPTTKSFIYGGTYGSLPTPTRTGYTFDGWYTAKTGGTKITADTKVTITANQTLYAHWTPKSITVTFYRNQNGSDTDSVKETFTYDTANQKFGYKTDGTGRYSTMNDPSIGFGGWKKTGYQMLGWSAERNSNSKLYSTYSGVSNDWINSYSPSINLYAQWSINKVNVHFNANGGSIAGDSNYYLGENADIYVVKDQKILDNFWEYNQKYENGLYNATTFKLTRTGYTFLGWSIKKDGGTIFDQDDGNVSANDLYPDITAKSGTITLYAQWEKNKVKGDCDDNGTLEVKDAVLLQRWLLSAPDTTLANWQAADLNNDGVLDVFDLALLKRTLLSNK